jgi:hypothetical protein
MHPGLFSSIPPSWRGVIVFIVTVLAFSVLMEKEFPEVFRDELMFKKLEDVVSVTLGFEPEHNPRSESPSLNASENMDLIAKCMRQFPNNQAAISDCEKKSLH